jgi:hypothetical protein
MDRIAFEWKETTSLASELLQPIHKLSVESVFPQSGISCVTLWRAAGLGIEICNTMHDVAERTEVGVLGFKRVVALPTYECILETVHLDSVFQRELKISKLVIEESGTQAESGIEITAEDGSTIAIVASVFPCCLEVRGVKVSAKLHGSEYPLDKYSREPINAPDSSFRES